MSCQNSKCVNQGHFEGNQCPGSDDEEDLHHCVDCHRLWWSEKGLSCDLCLDFWCWDWQHTFTFIDCPLVEENYQGEEDEELPEQICFKCYHQNSQYWCPDPKNCDCDCAYQIVCKKYYDWLAEREEKKQENK